MEMPIGSVGKRENPCVTRERIGDIAQQFVAILPQIDVFRSFLFAPVDARRVSRQAPMGKAERSRLARERIGHIGPFRVAFGHRRHDSGTDAGNTIRDLRHFRRPSATWEAFRPCRPTTGVRFRDGANGMRVAIQVGAVAAPDSGIFANASSVLARASWRGIAATSNLRHRLAGLQALAGDRVGAGCRNVRDQKRKSAPEERHQTIRNCRRRK